MYNSQMNDNKHTEEGTNRVNWDETARLGNNKENAKRM